MDPIYSLQAPLLAFLDIGGGEFIVIVFVALILFGGKLPDVARNVGRTVGNLKRQADELTREFRDEFHDASRPGNPRRYDPPRRIVPTKDPRSLGSDRPEHALFSDPADASDPLGGAREPVDPVRPADHADPVDEDGMAHAPEEERRRAEEDGFFHSAGAAVHDGHGIPRGSQDDESVNDARPPLEEAGTDPSPGSDPSSASESASDEDGDAR